MLKLLRIFVVTIACFSSLEALSASTTKTGIALDSEWRQKLYAYAELNVRHSIWGIAHSERNYQIAVQLAVLENLAIDLDVLFAAAFLHDIGAIEPFRIKGIEHAIPLCQERCRPKNVKNSGAKGHRKWFVNQKVSRELPFKSIIAAALAQS